MAYIITCTGVTRFIDQFVMLTDGMVGFSIGSVKYKISGDKIYRYNGHVFDHDPTIRNAMIDGVFYKNKGCVVL